MKKIILIVLSALILSFGSVSAQEENVEKNSRYARYGLNVQLVSSGAHLRQQSVDGKIGGTVPNGSIISVISMPNATLESDGYQWFNGTGTCDDGEQRSGSFQYDYDVMFLYGTPLDYSTMFLRKSGAYIRKTIQGEVITLAPKNDTFTVLRFHHNKQSDGYRWMEVDYDGIRGFAQYDPAVMMPNGL